MLGKQQVRPAAAGLGILTAGCAVLAPINPAMAVVGAAAVLFGISLLGHHDRIVHATLIVTFMTVPHGVPEGIRVGGYFVWIYEIFLVGSVVYAVRVFRRSPAVADRLRATPGVWAAAVFVAALVTAGAIGFLNGYPLKDLQLDVRPAIDMLLVLFVTTVVVAADEWRRYLNTLTAVLGFSAALMLYASLTQMSLGGRTEKAELYAGGSGDVLTGGSDALRYLTPTTPLAVACLAACFALVVLGRLRTAQVAPLLIASLTVTFFSFSRNSLLILTGTLLFAILVAVADRSVMQLLPRMGVIVGVTTALVFGVVTLGRAAGGGEWIDAQTDAYGNRVLTVFSEQVEANDGSVQYRQQENRYLSESSAEHWLLGGGFGFRYKPAVGARDSFEADRGQLYAHNSYGWLYVKAGLFGLAAFVFLIAASVLPALRTRRSDSVVVAMAATLVGLAAAMVVLPMILDHGNSAVVGLVIGGCIGAASYGAREKVMV